MRKLSENQKRVLRELNERNSYLEGIILERIAEPSQPLPLMLMLETRYNELMKAGIKLEGEVKYIKNNRDDFSDEMLFIKERRLDMIKGQLNELDNVMELISNFAKVGREFTVERFLIKGGNSQ